MKLYKIMILGALLSIAVLPVPHPSAAQPTTVVPPAPTQTKPVEVISPSFVASMHLSQASFLPHQMSPPPAT